MVRSLTPETLVYDLVGAGDPTISPDGARILYSLGRADRAAKLAGSQLWVCDIDGGSARQLTRAGDRNGQGRWAPDGSRIAFVSDRVAKSGVFVMALDGGEPREVTRHNGPVADLAWSPDGTRLAYVALFDPENPDERDLEEWEASRVRVTRRVDYKQDNRGYLADLRGQVWIVEVETGERRMLTGGAFDHNQPQWSPDGERIAAKVPTKNGMCSHLAVVDVQSGQVTEVGPEGGVVGCWAWSPEGDRILIAGDATPTWQLDLFVHFTGTGDLARLTDDLACLPDAGFPTVTPASQPVWLDETRALFHAVRAGQSGLYVVDTTTGDVEALVSWQALNGGLSVDAAGHFAVQGHTSLEEVGEILVTDLAGRSSRVITRHNAELLAEAPPARWERIDVQRGEFTIEAWLLSPAGFEGGEGGATRPLVLDVHGGPNGFYGYGFNAVQQSLAAAGNFVLYCNPRGSSSYGRHFTAQVTRDWGGEDYLDLMAAVDEAVTRPGVDAERLGVY
ncbi:MAG: prolyl oligopeptidase family serine peptidase, partial [Thermomicrobiales bacterium]